MMNLKVMVFINGIMVNHIKDSLNKVTCMVKANFIGLKDKFIKEPLKMIKNMAMENLFGEMVFNLKVIIKMV